MQKKMFYYMYPIVLKCILMQCRKVSLKPLNVSLNNKVMNKPDIVPILSKTDVRQKARKVCIK